jgi:hypothetical protein
MRPALAMIVLATAAGSARADVGPVTPATQYVNPVHRIETTDAHPNHVFVVVRQSFQHPEMTAEFVELAPGRPISLPTGYYDEPELLIVPRLLAEPFPSAAELARAARGGQLPKVVRRKFHFRETVPSWTSRSVTITYRLDRTGSGDGWELVRTSWSPMWQWYVAAGFVTVAVVAGGFWLVRRMVRRPRTP